MPLQDLKAVAELAKAENIVTIFDNSYCTPLYQKPIELGIDLALQTATKYIGGHSDTVGGVLCGTKAMIKKNIQQRIPEYRQRHSTIQCMVADTRIANIAGEAGTDYQYNRTSGSIILKQHPKVEKVIFPFDESFPQYELAKKQMSGACGLLTFIIKADTVEQIEIFCESLKHILMAVSWGGHESLIIPKCWYANRVILTRQIKNIGCCGYMWA